MEARNADLESLLADLGSLLGVSFRPEEKGGRQQLKTSKITPVSSGLPVLPEKLPPSVLAVRGDSLVFSVSKIFKKHANHHV